MRHFYKHKKAQITIFIIIGIIILLGFGTYVYISGSQKAETIPSETIIEKIPVQFQPIGVFVESCLIKTSAEALDKIGKSGGYTDLTANAIISNPSEPTESNAFRFFPEDENSETAYWWYFKSSNNCLANCECSSEMPYLRKEDGTPSVEAELEKYIDLNMEACLDDFTSFKQQGYIVEEKGELKTTATIAENDIPILVEYPLKVKKGDSEEDIKNFFVRIPLNLNRIYELASEITRKEIRYPYLERWTQEEIDAFGLGVNKSLPPTASASFDPDRDFLMWSKSESKNLLMNNILPYYTSFFQVFNTANYIERTDYYARTTLPIASPAGKSYSDLEVVFEYLNWWPIYLDITGRGASGDFITPDVTIFPLLNQLGASLGLERSNFYYDLSYPVRVDIYDSKALNNKGYHFYIGLESNVRNNKPLNCTGAGMPSVVGYSGSLLCSNQQRCANITIIANDTKTGEHIEDVLISYGTTEQCNLGKTSSSGDEILLRTELPSCIGCSLFLSKPGYFSYPLVYSVRCDNENCDDEYVLCNNENLTVNIEPKRTINAKVKKKRMLKDPVLKKWALNNAPVNLLNDEYAIFTIEKIKEDIFEEDIIVSQVIEGSSIVELKDSLIPGDYSASVQLFYELPDSYERTEIEFKSKRICADCCDWRGRCKKHETLGPQIFDSTFPEGSSQVDFTITKENLDNSDTIVLYVISSPDSLSFDILGFDDLEMMGKSEEFNEEHKLELKPTFE